MHGRWKLGAGALGVAALLAGAAASAGPAVASASRSVALRTVTSRPEVVVHGVGNIQKASNWSGYAETAGGYTSVTGTWKVPTSKNKSGTHFSAQWIGIDGDGNDDLIQTGTQVQYEGGSVSYGAWWEILPASETPISDPVRPGDTIKASITKESSGKWLIEISDGTKWSFSITKSYSGPGKSVEWIVEAPEVGGSIASIGHTSNATFSGITANGANPNLVAADAIECVQNSKVVESPSKPSASGDAFTMA